MGNKSDRKHKKINIRFRLESKKRRLETEKLAWKQNKYIENNLLRLETFTDWKQIRSQSDQSCFKTCFQSTNFVSNLN